MIIYKLTNKINNKVYIGQTVRTLEERIAEHKRKRLSLISKAIKKYGIENFEIEIIDSADTMELLNEKEVDWINKFKCVVPYGYNQCEGGGNTKGFHHRDDSKKKMSESKSILYIGEGNPFYGKTHSDEVKKRFSEQRKGRKLTDEWKRKISESNTHKKKVINLDTLEVFDTVRKAAEKYNLKDTHISRVCKGKRKRTGGFRWMHYDEYMAIPSQACKCRKV